MARRKSSTDGGTTRSKGTNRVRSETTEQKPQQTGELFPGLEPSVKERTAPPQDHPGESPDPLRNSGLKQLLKFFIGIVLTPPCLILTASFLQAFSSSVKKGLLANQSFGCFAAGLLLFVILFAVVPRKILMLPYVFGHEVTHAIWVKIFGGKVADQFHVSLDGGHVLTDRVNTLIILSPYFFPIYSVLAATLYGALVLSSRLIDWMHQGSNLAAGVDSFRWALFLVLGLTLAFHLVFTFLLITKGQPDLHYGGTFFSLTVIYLINLLIITALLLSTSKPDVWSNYWESLTKNSVEFMELCGRAVAWLVVWIEDLRTGLGK